MSKSARRASQVSVQPTRIAEQRLAQGGQGRQQLRLRAALGVGRSFRRDVLRLDNCQVQADAFRRLLDAEPEEIGDALSR